MRPSWENKLCKINRYIYYILILPRRKFVVFSYRSWLLDFFFQLFLTWLERKLVWSLNGSATCYLSYNRGSEWIDYCMEAHNIEYVVSHSASHVWNLTKPRSMWASLIGCQQRHLAKAMCSNTSQLRHSTHCAAMLIRRQYIRKLTPHVG